MIRNLVFPSFDVKTLYEDGKPKIFDVIRKKYVQLTPEEWVRQHLVHYLINYCRYPASKIALEKGLIFNKLQKRFDVLVYSSAAKPWLLAECKAPSEPINATTLRQALVYNSNKAAEYIALTNGLKLLLFKVSGEDGPTQINEFPIYTY